MNKSLLIFASLAIGTAAFAQETPAPPPPPETSAPPLAADAPAAPVTDPAPPPTADNNATAAPADTASYPPCSRNVQDKCMQTHAARRHMAHRRR